MSPSGVEYLHHILDESAFIANAISGCSREKFRADEMLKRAVVRSLEIIGEAAKQVPDPIRAGSAEIEWRAMAGIRDRLIHDYFGVDYDIVWDVATHRIPDLVVKIRNLLGTLEQSGK